MKLTEKDLKLIYDSACFSCESLKFSKKIYEVKCAKKHKVFVSYCEDFKRLPSICGNCKNMDGLKYSSLFEDYICGKNHKIGFLRSCVDFNNN